MGLTLGSLFDGIAGFPLSASRYGIVTKWASEIEPFPIRVSQKHFPNMKHLGDVSLINGAEIEPVDIISFGSPCQDMSVAGKRAGLEGERSVLFMEAVRIIKEMRQATNGNYPRYAIWENVPGAFSSNGGNDFRAVLEEITEAEIPIPKSGRWAESGMVGGNGRSVAWRVLDAQHWGVPQRRKRIFLVADFRGECAGEILFIEQGMSGNSQESEEAGEEVATSARNGTKATSRITADGGVIVPAITSKWHKGTGGPSGNECQNMILEPLMVENHPADSRVKIDETGTTQTLTSRMGTGGGNVPMLMQPITMACSGFCNYSESDIAATQRTCIAKQTDVDLVLQPTYAFQPEQGAKARGIGFQEECSPTLKAEGATSAIAQPVFALDRASFNQGENALYDFQIDTNGKTQTVIARGPNAVAVAPMYRVRRLTPTECLRLQGFPDNWLDIEGASDSAKYKAVGNSVAIPCVEFIFSQIVKILEMEAST